MGIGLRAHLLEDVPKWIKTVNRKPQLALHFDVLVTTPNRLVYLLKSKPAVITLKNTEWLVIDESDKLFEAHVTGGFRDQASLLITRTRFFPSIKSQPCWCRRLCSDLISY